MTVVSICGVRSSQLSRCLSFLNFRLPTTRMEPRLQFEGVFQVTFFSLRVYIYEWSSTWSGPVQELTGLLKYKGCRKFL